MSLSVSFTIKLTQHEAKSKQNGGTGHLHLNTDHHKINILLPIPISCVFIFLGVYLWFMAEIVGGWSESLPASLPSPEQCKFYDPKSRDCQTIHSNHTEIYIKSVESIMHQYGENKHRKNAETALSPGRPGMPCGLSNPGFHEVKCEYPWFIVQP